MKKILFLLLLSIPLLVSKTNGQKKEKDTAKVVVPIKDGAIFYENVFEHPGQTKDQLYNLSLKWLANNFVDSKEVLRMKDKDAGSVVGNGNFDIQVPGFVGLLYNVSFMIDVTLKDGKSRVRFYQFQDKVLTTSRYNFKNEYKSTDKSLERYYANKSPFPKDDKKFFGILNTNISSLFESYKIELNRSAQTDDF